MFLCRYGSSCRRWISSTGGAEERQQLQLLQQQEQLQQPSVYALLGTESGWKREQERETQVLLQ